ncbi:type III-D CRISPR-associated protein Csx19 [Desulfolucanica intricata]|uniref:type III-D CRISPR-associated protein Csx19 n=1 Tax=Desulfolucanica intricata TaxID=1285191 RepID=UPI0008316636|nr:CRISPR-associated protein Csx19 [Desulfolucanica intricata]
MYCNNGLTLGKVKSSYIINELVIDNYGKLIEKVVEIFKDNGFVVAYLYYKVLIGKFENGKLIFYQHETIEPKYLQTLRVFNDDKELLLWSKGEKFFNVRLRVDGEGEELDYIDAKQILWGTESKEKKEGWSTLIEDRGTEIIIPLSGLKLDVNKKRLKLKTRNYIGCNEVGQAGYIDSRFVSFGLGED